jgi:hypothetical protein
VNNQTIINAILFFLGFPCFLVVYYLDKKGWINWFRGLIVVVAIAYTLTLSSPLIGPENVRVLVISFFWAMLPVIVLDLAFQLSKQDEWGKVFDRMAREDREQLRKERGSGDAKTYRR